MNTSPLNLSLLVCNSSNSVIRHHHAVTAHRIAYTPFGYGGLDRSAGVMGFNGEARQPDSENYPLGNGHRTFNTVLQRFHSPDRLSPFTAGGLNSYAYCLGDPVNRVDPSGQVPIVQRILQWARQWVRRPRPAIQRLTESGAVASRAMKTPAATSLLRPADDLVTPAHSSLTHRVRLSEPVTHVIASKLDALPNKIHKMRVRAIELERAIYEKRHLIAYVKQLQLELDGLRVEIRRRTEAFNLLSAPPAYASLSPEDLPTYSDVVKRAAALRLLS
jgi:RHS repeat-associated protein